MLARRRNILQVIMPGMRRHPRNPILRILAHAVRMANVEIQAHPRRIDAAGKLQVLLEALDQEPRLRLDQQEDFEFLRQGDARHDFIIKNLRRPAMTRPASRGPPGSV